MIFHFSAVICDLDLNRFFMVILLKTAIMDLPTTHIAYRLTF